MFVTMQCFNNLKEDEETRPMTERFGLTMRRAGAAITITSLTDFLAFAVGGTTVRGSFKTHPRYFCLLFIVHSLCPLWPVKHKRAFCWDTL